MNLTVCVMPGRNKRMRALHQAFVGGTINNRVAANWIRGGRKVVR